MERFRTEGSYCVAVQTIGEGMEYEYCSARTSKTVYLKLTTETEEY